MSKTARQRRKRLLALLMAAVLVCSNTMVALAAEAPDFASSEGPAATTDIGNADDENTTELGDDASSVSTPERDEAKENDETEASDETEVSDEADVSDQIEVNSEATTGEFTGVVPDVNPPTSYTEVYERLMDWEDILPTGTPWNDDLPYGEQGNLGDGYIWKGGLIDGHRIKHVGCAAFAAILSDAAFGNLPATKIDRGGFTFEEVRVGDVLRVNGSSHSVIVLQTNPAGVIVAEGNNSGKVYWGRTMSKQDVLYADFILTRYPNGFVSDDEEEAGHIVDQGEEAGFNWTLSKSGVLTISGSGDMPNFSPNDGYMPSWSKTTYPVNTVVIENGITSIGEYAFYQSSLLSVDIAETVTKIGNSAFQQSKLISADIPGNVVTIGNQAFRDCKNLGTLILAEGTKTIGDEAFRGCTAISGILNIPASVTYVGNGAFISCSELMSIQFRPSDNAVTIGDSAFAQCWKTLSIKLPEKLTKISSGLVQSCTMLGYLYIPASVQEISVEDGNSFMTSPFVSSSIVQIDFGGSEETWNAIGGNTALRLANKLDQVKVYFNIEPDEAPFDPNKPVDPDPPKPIDPVNPDPPKPVDPVDPDPPKPVDPVDPDPPKPVEPSNPDDSDETDTPSRPSRPNRPHTPSKPNKPNANTEKFSEWFKEWQKHWEWYKHWYKNWFGSGYWCQQYTYITKF